MRHGDLMNIKIQVNDYSVSPKRFIGGTKGSYGFSHMDFEFSNSWEGLAKTISFYPPSGNAVSLVFSGESIQIPSEVMTQKGISKFMICGTRNENTLLSVTGEIDILETATPAEIESVPPTPDEMQQILTLMQNTLETAQSVREDADNGAFKGDKGDNYVLTEGDKQEIAEIVVELIPSGDEVSY